MRNPMNPCGHKQEKRRTQRCRGFTLVELAISVVVVGLVISAGAQAYSIYLKNLAVTTTKTNVETVASTVASYLSVTGRYPCPASLTAQRGDPAYGHESTTSAADCTSATLPPGVYTRISNRTPGVQYKSAGVNIPGGLQAPIVRVGAIPFRELNLDESQAIDGYGNRIVYAVTERLATTQSYQQDGGGIDVRGASGTSLLSSQGTAHFFIYSAGLDGAGAYSRDGVLVSACPPNFPENANCATTSPAAFSAVETVTNPGAGHFDDVVNYYTQSNIPLWQVSAGDPSSIREKPDGSVGVFHPDMSGTYKVIIPGTTHVSGNIMADYMSDPSGNRFPSSLISGTWPVTGVYADNVLAQKGIGCPPNQYMTGLVHDHATCSAEIWNSCLTNTYATGVDANGKLVCSPKAPPPPSKCAATQAALCTGNVDLAEAASGASVTVASGNVSEVYTCNNGSWSHGSPKGVCDCAATLLVKPNYTTTSSCGTGYTAGTGTYTNSFTFSCSANSYVSTNNKASACICTPSTIAGSKNCGPNPPYSGSYPTTQAGICVNNVFTLGAVLPATQPASCVCTPKSDKSTASCAAGLTGTRTIQTDYSCPDAKKTVTDLTQPGDCTCVPTSSVSTQNCPTGQIPNPNGIQLTSNYVCSKGPNSPGVWTSPVQTANDCIDAPKKQCSWSALSSGAAGQPAGIGPAAGSGCTCGILGACSSRQGANSYVNYPSCFCQ